ncbi:MAG: hypothetical protein IJO05_02730 [Oscillospiraceae bacterium]|nr:hypothetical protein [Oscillospiraceae bacterium]
MKLIRYAVLFLLLFSVLGRDSLCMQTYASTNKEVLPVSLQNHELEITHKQGIRDSNWYQFDATQKYIYFSYSLYNCVDVYDLDGNFCFTIILPASINNGCVSIRCDGEKVYISSKDNTLYIWDEEDAFEILDSGTAIEKGYDFYWFYNNSPRIIVDKQYISFLDNNSGISKQIGTPKIISDTMPFTRILNVDFNMAIPLIIVCIGVLVILFAFYFHTVKRWR